MAVHTEDEAKQYTRDLNNKQCVPPLDDKEFEKQWKCAIEFVKKKKEESQELGSQHKEYKHLSLEEIENAVREVMSRRQYKTLEETEEMLYYDEGGVYLTGGERRLKMDLEEIHPQITTHCRKEIINHVNYRTNAKKEEFDQDKNVINMKNGLYHIDTNTLTPHTAGYLSMKQISIPYDPNAKSEEFGKFLSEVLYKSDIRTAVEIMAYTFLRDNPYEIITVLLGSGGNGKSVYTDLISALHGSEDICQYNFFNRLCKHYFSMNKKTSQVQLFSPKWLQFPESIIFWSTLMSRSTD
jgi:putative DNA primase/helicase